MTGLWTVHKQQKSADRKLVDVRNVMPANQALSWGRKSVNNWGPAISSRPLQLSISVYWVTPAITAPVDKPNSITTLKTPYLGHQPSNPSMIFQGLQETKKSIVRAGKLTLQQVQLECPRE
jgi:hypothetical protein